MDEKRNEQQISPEERLEEAIQKYLPSAEAGDPVAQYDLGCCYFQGGEFDKSLHWWEKAAEQGVNQALVRIGLQYGYGLGVEKDEQKALDCVRKAVERNPRDAVALCNLGLFYEQGIGMEADMEQAVQCYRQAAEENEPMALFNLAMCYYAGNGVAQDADAAMEWAKKSADLGYPEALHFMGFQYYMGELVPGDINLAIQYLRAAAEGGSQEAQKMLNLVEKERQMQNIEGVKNMLDDYEAYMMKALEAEGLELADVEWDDEEEQE
jgi:hypothetical protein